MQFNKKKSEAGMIKQIFRISTLCVLFTMAATAAILPSNSGDLAATIPFDFVVGSQTLEAGEYIVRSEPDTGTLQICEDGVYCVTVQTRAVAAVETFSAQPQLVFHQVGDRRLLTRISSPQYGTMRLPGTMAEKAAVGTLVREISVSAQELSLFTHPGLAPSWY